MAVTGSIRQVIPPLSYAASGKTMWLYDMTATTDAAAGTVTEVPVSVEPGGIDQIDFIPDATTPVDNLCDLTILNAQSDDILEGQGANIVIATEDGWKFDPPYAHPGGSLYPTMANGGNSKKFRIRIHVVK